MSFREINTEPYLAYNCCFSTVRWKCLSSLPGWIYRYEFLTRPFCISKRSISRFQDTSRRPSSNSEKAGKLFKFATRFISVHYPVAGENYSLLKLLKIKKLSMSFKMNIYRSNKISWFQYNDELLKLLTQLTFVDQNLIWYKSLVMAAVVNKSPNYVETLNHIEKMRKSLGFLDSFKFGARLCAVLLLIDRPEGSTYFTTVIIIHYHLLPLLVISKY